MVRDVATLGPEDTVAKAFSQMIDRGVNQIPIVDEEQQFRYQGMVFAKNFLNSSAQPSSKLKGYTVNTPTLSPSDSVEKAAEVLIGTGNRALPVTEKGKVVGIVSETDLVLTCDFGHASVDEVMSGAIVIDRETSLADAMSKMRRYNISRLPVIDSKGILCGALNMLDIVGIIAVPRERTSKSAAITGSTAAMKDVKVKDLMRRSISAERGTKLNSLVDNFRRNEEVVIVGEGGRPMGIVTPKDALELTLPKKGEPVIQIAHLPDEADRAEIHEQIARFLKKIQGKLGDIRTVVVYADKHKTRKYSLRTRVITTKGVVEAKAIGYDPISASKELIVRLDRRIKAEHSQKVESRKHRESARRA